MLSFSPATRIFLALTPVDGRKSFNGLHCLVKETLQQDPISGFLFVFTNRSRNDPKLEPLLEELTRMHTGFQELLVQRDTLIAEQKSLIEQLKRMLFGPKSEKLTPEQENQLAEVAADLQEQVARPNPDSQEVLSEEEDQESRKDKPRRRRPLPVDLEVTTTILEPADAACEHCGRLGDKIGEEVGEQVDLIPAKLIVRRTVRIKRKCQCGCGKIAIAALPPQILPGSKLGLGLAVFILLSKYDDHLALHTLERIFRERHGVAIPRQQMVQWIVSGKRAASFQRLG